MDLFDLNRQFVNTGDELPRSTGKLSVDEAEYIEEQKNCAGLSSCLLQKHLSTINIHITLEILRSLLSVLMLKSL